MVSFLLFDTIIAKSLNCRTKNYVHCDYMICIIINNAIKNAKSSSELTQIVFLIVKNRLSRKL